MPAIGQPPRVREIRVFAEEAQWLVFHRELALDLDSQLHRILSIVNLDRVARSWMAKVGKHIDSLELLAVISTNQHFSQGEFEFFINAGSLCWPLDGYWIRPGALLSPVVQTWSA